MSNKDNHVGYNQHLGKTQKWNLSNPFQTSNIAVLVHGRMTDVIVIHYQPEVQTAKLNTVNL